MQSKQKNIPLSRDDIAGVHELRTTAIARELLAVRFDLIVRRLWFELITPTETIIFQMDDTDVNPEILAGLMKFLELLFIMTYTIGVAIYRPRTIDYFKTEREVGAKTVLDDARVDSIEGDGDEDGIIDEMEVVDTTIKIPDMCYNFHQAPLEVDVNNPSEVVIGSVESNGNERDRKLEDTMWRQYKTMTLVVPFLQGSAKTSTSATLFTELSVYLPVFRMTQRKLALASTVESTARCPLIILQTPSDSYTAPPPQGAPRPGLSIGNVSKRNMNAAETQRRAREQESFGKKLADWGKGTLGASAAVVPEGLQFVKEMNAPSMLDGFAVIKEFDEYMKINLGMIQEETASSHRSTNRGMLSHLRQRFRKLFTEVVELKNNAQRILDEVCTDGARFVVHLEPDYDLEKMWAGELGGIEEDESYREYEPKRRKNEQPNKINRTPILPVEQNSRARL